MEKKVDIVALGELLIDFTEAGVSKAGMKLFEQNPGGAPANLLTVANHMGYRTAFIGKVGADMHGAFLRKTLRAEGIDTAALVEDADCFTTLAFVEIAENGERKFSFARKPGAGDSFWGGFLSRFLFLNKGIDDLEWEEIRTCAVMGNVVAGLCVQKRGGIPSIPGPGEVEEFMRNALLLK